jgi:sensor histidine kinase regulating citrate/malate metabolism
MRINDFLNFMREAFQYHSVAEGKTLTIEGEVTDQIIESDYQLVRRIIGNMLINAFEATELGGTIILSCCKKRDGVEFRGHNHRIIHKKNRGIYSYRDVATKGHGRGTGTFSTKLLNSILDGEVQFTSTEPEGTTFSLWLPRQHKE